MPRKKASRRDFTKPPCFASCGRDGVIWAKLQWWCPTHKPDDETPASNCSHIHKMTAHGKTICSWCLGTLGGPT